MCISPGSAFQAAGEAVQGVSDYNAGNANAQIAKMEGQSAWAQALDQAAQISNAGQRFLGTTQARQAASGVDITTGSAADVTAESARNIELDRLNAIYSGQMKRWSKVVEYNIDKAGAKTGLTTGLLKSAGTLLGSSGGGGWPGMGGAGGGAAGASSGASMAAMV